MHTSCFTIYVDLPERRDQVLLVHGYTGAYDIVSSDVADYLRAHDPQKFAKPLFGAWTPRNPPAFLPDDAHNDPTLAHLEMRGYLTEKTAEEEYAFVQGAAERLHVVRRTRAPEFIFIPTYDCNLRCPYCFQGHMRADTGKHLRPMSVAMADRLIEGLRSIEAHHDIPKTDYVRSIGFFGGEPLLRENRQVLEHIISRITEMGPAHFWAVTNATELEAFGDLLGPGGIDTLQITLDGIRQKHDERRKHPDGTGSFTQITSNIHLALERGAAVQVRINVDRSNLSALPEIARYAISAGWNSFSNFDLYTAPIHGAAEVAGQNGVFSTRQLSDALDGLRASHPEMTVFRQQDTAIKMRAQKMMAGDANALHALKSCFCSANDRMYILDGFADVYACWEHTCDRQQRIGSIAEDGKYRVDPEMEQIWHNRSAASNPVCRQCRYVFYCGGGCANLAEQKHHSYLANFCDEYAMRFRRRVAEAYLEHATGHKDAPTTCNP